MTGERAAGQEAWVRKCFSGGWRFESAALATSDLPSEGRYEVPFWGRSNVGKSSLINALTRQRYLARSSRTAGRTQQIIFFSHPEVGHFRLVDLPGYGYNQSGKTLGRRFGRSVIDYLSTRRAIHLLFLLIDPRRGLRPHDCEMLDVMDRYGLAYRCVATKADKIGDALEERMAALEQELASRGAYHQEVLCTSATSGLGLEAMRGMLFDLPRIYDAASAGSL